MSQPGGGPQQYSIATLLLVTTLIAVCLGLFRIHPGLGAAGVLFAVPALLRTLALAERERQYGNRLSAAEKVAVYFGSLAITLLFLVTMAAISVVGYFIAIGMAQLLAPWFPILAAVVGLVGVVSSELLAIYGGGWIILRTYPSREEFLAGLHRAGPAVEPRDPSLAP